MEKKQEMFSSNFLWCEDNQKIRIRRFRIRVGIWWTRKNYMFSSLILFLHLIQHWIWAPSSKNFTLLIFFYSDSFFFKTYQCNTKFMWCSYKFFLEPKKRHSSMCSRMVGLLIRTEKPNSGPKQHCCLPTPLSRTIQNIAVVATCGHCGPT